jgi:MFS family permease
MACAFILSMKLLVALSLLFGAAIGCFWPAIVAWIGEGLSGRALSRRVAGFCVSWNIGLLLGFALTGYVFERSPQLAFVIPSVTILVIAVLLQLPVRMAAAPVPTETAPADLIPKGRGFRKTAWLANFGANFATAAAMALFPQLATALDISADTHGVLLAVGRAAALATFVAMQLTAFWHTRLWPLWVAQAVGALGVALVAWGESTWVFALAFIIMGVLTGVSFQAAVFFTLEEMSEKGKGSGFNEAVVGSGLFLGPLLAGRVGDQFGQRAPYLFCGWVLVFLIAVQMALVRCRRRRTPR